MKKITISTLFLLIAFVSLNAQSYDIIFNDSNVTNDTVWVYEYPNQPEVVVDLIFKNNTSNGANIKVIREELLMLDGTSSYFHWAQTYDDTVNLSTEFIYIPAGGYSQLGAFVGYYRIADQVGMSYVKYTFFNIDNESEEASVIVEFNTISADIDEYRYTVESNIYPNPANSSVSVDYQLQKEIDNASICIINMYGSVVKNQEIDSGIGKLQIDISDIKSGIYFVSICINKEAYLTKKLIVK